jgi:hypothetical protein
VAKRIVQASTVETLTFEEALQAALEHVTVQQLEDNPAALCLLSAKDERRVVAGSVLRRLLCEGGHADIAAEYLRVMGEMGISHLAARSFWHAYADLTRRWVDDSVSHELCKSNLVSPSSKASVPSRPVLFSIHVPRA